MNQANAKATEVKECVSAVMIQTVMAAYALKALQELEKTFAEAPPGLSVHQVGLMKFETP